MHTIDDVIERLDQITDNTIADYDPLGYFAALYRRVTFEVKQSVDHRFFENSQRMEKLAVIFAKRYFTALETYMSKKEPTKSWKASFDVVDNFWMIVFQHIMTGMNAHINLDLAIAAAEVGYEDMDDLKRDFFRINDILASLVDKVERDLSEVWPTLSFVLKMAGKADNFLIDFSMKKARDGAWEFARYLAHAPRSQWDGLINERDQRVAEKAKLITKPGVFVSAVFMMIRIGERGNVPMKIKCLMD
ncbi:hypothetical protein BFP72_14810 [Reichenbachiella sp. 5M10]|uniref:DUF5995 family protein n=1 Tax=Reichenbachiella sp. 5M10 TaxID=1889772 RepID=UPI000C161071|nr:DUF5995 family protein [Reichenbachiella sp. 5M10]PIB36580.1 hypothetical protein BFP72_14810 [Reichenbachiella sp. 5M10]